MLIAANIILIVIAAVSVTINAILSSKKSSLEFLLNTKELTIQGLKERAAAAEGTAERQKIAFQNTEPLSVISPIDMYHGVRTVSADNGAWTMQYTPTSTGIIVRCGEKELAINRTELLQALSKLGMIRIAHNRRE